MPLCEYLFGLQLKTPPGDPHLDVPRANSVRYRVAFSFAILLRQSSVTHADRNPPSSLSLPGRRVAGHPNRKPAVIPRPIPACSRCREAVFGYSGLVRPVAGKPLTSSRALSQPQAEADPPQITNLPGASRPPAFSTTCSPVTISPGSPMVSPGDSRSLPGTKNICPRLTHGLNNSSLQILAIHFADGRSRFTLNRHRHKCFEFAGSLVPYDAHRPDLAEGAESVTQGVFACLTRQVRYTDVHSDFLLDLGRAISLSPKHGLGRWNGAKDWP